VSPEPTLARSAQAVPAHASIKDTDQAALAPARADVFTPALRETVPVATPRRDPTTMASHRMFTPTVAESSVMTQAALPRPAHDLSERLDIGSNTKAVASTPYGVHEARSAGAQAPLAAQPLSTARPSAEPHTDKPAPITPDVAREARSSAFVLPSERASSGERAQASTPRSSTASPPEQQAAQSTVRIGTITLEVHPPAVNAPTAPQPVAAAPTPASSQFSLRRHHVRWS
jgi:hypothetical protein